jgi:DNA repair exonuclease SbcCD ATPase subunit
MILRNLKASNFYSFKNLELNFSKFKGIVYVRGMNRDTGGSNGSGKSSIAEITTFALFGKTIRKSTEEAMVNCDARKGLSVTIDIEKPGVGLATITRTKKPTSLNFFLDDKDLTQENAAKTQELIESTLGINYKTYVASIMFGQHVEVEFLSASADDKRAIIRNFLNLDKMFRYRDKIKDLKSEYSNGSKTCDTVINELSKQADKLKSRLTNLAPVILTETLEDVQKRQGQITAFQEQITLYKWELDTIQNKIYPLERDKEKGTYSYKDTCKTCKKVYIKKQTEANLKGIQKKINGLAKKADKYTNLIAKLADKVFKLKNKLSINQWMELKIKHDEYLSQEKTRDDYNDLLSRIALKETVKQNYDVMYDVMRFWEKAFSEQGIIKYFVRNILDYLNFKTNEYLSILTNNQFSIVFNEELEETITNNGRKLSFISLSGGEKRKINLSVMLALQSLLTHTAKEQSNIMFFDEIAENMDEDGCKGIHNLLKALKEEDKTIFLITHNAYLKSLLDGCQILNIQKKNGESVIL